MIIFIVEDGMIVFEGDLVVELDKFMIEDLIN